MVDCLRVLLSPLSVQYFDHLVPDIRDTKFMVYVQPASMEMARHGQVISGGSKVDSTMILPINVPIRVRSVCRRFTPRGCSDVKFVMESYETFLPKLPRLYRGRRWSALYLFHK